MSKTINNVGREKCYFLKDYGSIHIFNVFEGVKVYFYDLRVISGESHNKLTEKILLQKDKVIEINHCYRGRYECEFETDSLFYLSEGNVSVSKLTEKKKQSGFPLEIYKGINILIDLDDITKEFMTIIDKFNIDCEKILNKWRSCLPCKIFEDSRESHNIFLSLYEKEDNMDAGYLKCKIIELALLFQTCELEDNAISRRISKEQVSKVKYIKEHLEYDLEREITLSEISEKYEISISSIRNNFYAVYGKSPNQFRKEYRMHTATKLLIETQESIADIGITVGYSNASKFASAFRSVINMSPTEYRKKRNDQSINISPLEIRIQ